MTTHFKTLIHSSLVIKALTALDVPLGGALIVNTGDENDGTCSWNLESDDRDEVLSKLVGIALAHYAVETMVMPSNADRLDNVRNFLDTLVKGTNRLSSFRQEELIELFEDFVYDIESVQANLRPDKS